MRAIHVREYGGPEVMTWTEFPDPVPGAGEVGVRLGVAGVNFMDTGARKMPLPTWSVPTVLGVEGMGIVTAQGPDVEGLAVGDRVAWRYHKGSYAEQLAIPADTVVRVPDDIDDETAAAILMQGLTANHFVTETYAVKAGDTAVVHSAAGGVGLLLTQLVKARGGTVIGLVSREDKVPVAEKAGADHVLVSAGGGFEGRVLELTGGEGAQVVYDGGGAATFHSSQRALRRHGVHAYYGVVNGNPTFRPAELPNSILLSYPSVADHVPTREALARRTNELFDHIRRGRLTPHIGGRYALADAAQAHRDIESRRTSGKLLLVP
ncbi:quinone oxidoreductase family protein [Amycolatopsis azurea]|uniref:Quinone oxidoreductase n=1 Tax=Amycolatopsis azurea DSM 43854 TaxID=1238180 RepID=M2P375_9PSEU|nr:quinone oxidoreductase [Amycolatopsis azurea]EMD29604.1 Quinone oxidoreductase [Amycolatopsis azurea DSM 43854]OOC02627.1 quinone oxidoreductase [Amycolatopsis azurea DSM 43854]